MARRGVRWLRVAAGLALLAVALVTALSIAATLASTLVACDTVLLMLCAIPIPPPPPDWTPVVALATVGVALLWPPRVSASSRGGRVVNESLPDPWPSMGTRTPR